MSERKMAREIDACEGKIGAGIDVSELYHMPSPPMNFEFGSRSASKAAYHWKAHSIREWIIKSKQS